MRALAKDQTRDAFATILDLMRNAEKEGTRLEAAKTVLRLAGVSFDSETAEETARQAVASQPPAVRTALDLVLGKPESPLN